MESLLKIIGSEIYIGSFLFSSGLEGKAYAEKLREAETLCRAVEEFYEADFQSWLSRFDIQEPPIYAPEPQPQSAT
jgi:urease accessory protein UreF